MAKIAYNGIMKGNIVNTVKDSIAKYPIETHRLDHSIILPSSLKKMTK
jgi:hypothetical protein